ncbi:hypothetical protein J5N97_007174 [Dioscorea zingiberensis]|uniref:Uncharacterized protein n=1 Tax=Dioscorea zingiberensis TaxID=325984 RepID=A0A9D5HU85_9LILI|nr:hypothetical protein J5N97_007174 [Dioscorea zingiberensis]
MCRKQPGIAIGDSVRNAMASVSSAIPMCDHVYVFVMNVTTAHFRAEDSVDENIRHSPEELELEDEDSVVHVDEEDGEARLEAIADGPNWIDPTRFSMAAHGDDILLCHGAMNPLMNTGVIQGDSGAQDDSVILDAESDDIEVDGEILFVYEAYRLIPMQNSDAKDYGLEALEEIMSIMSIMESGRIVVIFTGYRESMKHIKEADGEILFVYKAFRLIPMQNSDAKDYGLEALEEIMSVMESGRIVVIFVGYREPMKHVILSNERFHRRVTKLFYFDDFTTTELAQILQIKMTEQEGISSLYGFKLHPSCTVEVVAEMIHRETTEELRKQINGGLIKPLLANARENLDFRLGFDCDTDELITIMMEDLEAGL